jgi:hypothetical protein
MIDKRVVLSCLFFVRVIASTEFPRAVVENAPRQRLLDLLRRKADETASATIQEILDFGYN